MTEAEAVRLIFDHEGTITAALNAMHASAAAFYDDEPDITRPWIAVRAYGPWEIAQGDEDEDGFVPVGELHDGLATATLRLHPATGETREENRG